MDAALKESIEGAMSVGWILDCDTTVKPLYGHQDGATVGYNPTKPGRPSHNIHTYWIANMRLVLDAEVQSGTASAAKYSLPRLIKILDALSSEQRPRLVRGDSAFGNDPVMTTLEAMNQPYLFKLRQTAGVKRLVKRQWSRQDWQDVGQGCQAVEAQLTAGAKITRMIANVNAGLDTIRATAPQLIKPERWKALVRYIIEKIRAVAAKTHRTSTQLPVTLQLAESG